MELVPSVSEEFQCEIVSADFASLAMTGGIILNHRRRILPPLRVTLNYYPMKKFALLFYPHKIEDFVGALGRFHGDPEFQMDKTWDPLGSEIFYG